MKYVPQELHGMSGRMAVFRNEVTEHRLHATAFCLFHFSHDRPLLMLRRCNTSFRVRLGGFRPACSIGVNAVANLRTSCWHCCHSSIVAIVARIAGSVTFAAVWYSQ